ncbi:MAG: lipocalin family protein [Bacteroidales bacterium]|nr:lipocalin family protein [Bacteroidales bacterium]
MKNIVKIIAIVALCILTSCKKNGGGSDSICADWQLQSLETKSITVGSETVDVYLSFQNGGTFSIYQKVGEGRYRHYKGTWTLTGGTLEGQYADKTSWATSYSATVSGDVLTLVSKSDKVETAVYKKTTIPSSVISEAIEK